MENIDNNFLECLCRNYLAKMTKLIYLKIEWIENEMEDNDVI